MAMPKTTVNKDDATMAPEDEIWFTGKFLVMQSVSEAALMKQSPK